MNNISYFDTCNANTSIDLVLPQKSMPFAFFDINLPIDIKHAFKNLKYSGNMTYVLSDESCVTLEKVEQVLNFHQANSFYAKKATQGISTLVRDIYTEFYKLCFEVINFDWDVSGFINHNTSEPGWHLDLFSSPNSTSCSDHTLEYRIVIPFNDQGTLFYNEPFYYEDLSLSFEENIEKQTAQVDFKDITTTTSGYGAIFDLRYAIHSVPLKISNRMILIFDMTCGNPDCVDGLSFL